MYDHFEVAVKMICIWQMHIESNSLQGTHFILSVCLCWSNGMGLQEGLPVGPTQIYNYLFIKIALRCMFQT